MSEETIKNIIQKYKAGESSLEEEKMLIDIENKLDNSLKTWVSFAKQTSIETPKNLNKKLWISFEEKIRKPNKFKIGVFSAAASIIFIFSLFLYNKHQNGLYENEKSALLEEAKSMFINENKQQVIYNKILENDLIIVYTKTN